jgi:hypothetical protein
MTKNEVVVIRGVCSCNFDGATELSITVVYQYSKPYGKTLAFCLYVLNEFYERRLHEGKVKGFQHLKLLHGNCAR